MRRIKPSKKVERPYSPLTGSSKTEAQKVLLAPEYPETLKNMRDVAFTENDTDIMSRTWSTEAGSISGQSIIEAMAWKLIKGSTTLMEPLAAQEPMPTAKWQNGSLAWESPVPLGQLPDNHIKNPAITKKIKRITGQIKSLYEKCQKEFEDEITGGIKSPNRNEEIKSFYSGLFNIAYECRESINKIGTPFFEHVLAARNNNDPDWFLVLQEINNNLLDFADENMASFQCKPFKSSERTKAFVILELLNPCHKVYSKEIANALSAQEYEEIPPLLKKMEKCYDSGMPDHKIDRYNTSAEFYFTYGVIKINLSDEKSGQDSLILKREARELFKASIAYSDRFISEDITRKYLSHEHLIRLAKSYHSLGLISATPQIHFNQAIKVAGKTIEDINSFNRSLKEEREIALYKKYMITLLEIKVYSYIRIEKFKEALGCLDLLIEKGAAIYKTFYNKSVVLYKLNNYVESLKAAEIALDDINKSSEIPKQLDWQKTHSSNFKYKIQMQIGYSLKALKKHPEAMEAFQLALELAEDNTTASFQICLIHKNLGQISLAKMLLAQILPINPDDDNLVFYEMIMTLADMHYIDSEFDESISFYQRALNIQGLNVQEIERVQFRINYTLDIQKKLSTKVAKAPHAASEVIEKKEDSGSQLKTKLPPSDLKQMDEESTEVRVEKRDLPRSLPAPEQDTILGARQACSESSKNLSLKTKESQESKSLQADHKTKNSELTQPPKKPFLNPYERKKAAVNKAAQENRQRKKAMEEEVAAKKIAKEESGAEDVFINETGTLHESKRESNDEKKGCPKLLSVSSNEFIPIHLAEAHPASLISNQTQIRHDLILLAYKLEYLYTRLHLQEPKTYSQSSEKKIQELEENFFSLKIKLEYERQKLNKHSMNILLDEVKDIICENNPHPPFEWAPFKWLFPYQFEEHLSYLKFACNRSKWSIDADFEEAVSYLKVKSTSEQEYNPVEITGSADHHQQLAS